jgi:hypothetical protein
LYFDSLSTKYSTRRFIMLSFLKKLFAAKQSTAAAAQAPYKIEAPTVLVDGDTVTVSNTTEVATADVQASWPFPNNEAAPARTPRTPRKPATDATSESAAVPAKRPRKPRAPKA